MDKRKARERAEKLRKIIDHHRYLYHVLDKQEISEEALDSLKKELFDIEQEYPDLIVAHSPTQRIGGKPLDKFEKIKRKNPMLSLNDAFSKNDILEWIKRNEKLLGADLSRNLSFFCELKIDGLAVELIYRKGILIVGSTRGDGVTGEKVTENLKTIHSIPLRIKENLGEFDKIRGLKKTSREIADIVSQKEIIVRGEVFISRKNFALLNKQRKKEELSLYANPRNVAAGSIRQLDPKVAASRNLDSFAYDLVTDLGADTHEKKHLVLKALGFKVNSYENLCRDAESIFKFYGKIIQIRENLPYEIDGVIATINDNAIFNELGVVGKSPRGSIAYKFPLKESTTIIEDIIVQISRTGILTPVAILKPVSLSGVMVGRATLHNEDEIKRLGLKIGDTVVVGRAGDVIPDIIKVIAEFRSGKEKKFNFPEKCPSCGSKIKKATKVSTIFYCPNEKCLARIKEYFSYFVSRKGFNLEGLGEKIIEKLIEKKLVVSPADLFFLGEKNFLTLEGFQEKLARKIVSAIKGRKEISLARLLYSLGIENVGEETSLLLEEKFGTLSGIQKASLEKLLAIKDIGEVTAGNIYEWFRNEKNINFLKKIELAGIKIIEEKKSGKKNKFNGKTFILTGSLESMARETAKERIKNLGGRVSENISSETDFVIVGNNPGSKLGKARELGTKEIREREFIQMIKSK